MALRREEEKLGAFTLLKHLRRIVAYVRGRWVLLLACVLLSLLQAGIELSLPLLVRHGIDRYIMAPYLRVDLSAARSIAELQPGLRGKLIDAGDGHYAFILTASLSEGERAELSARHLLGQAGWYRIDGGPSEAAHFISDSEFRKLPAARRASLREGARHGVFVLALLYVGLLLLDFLLSFGVTMGLNHLGQRAVQIMRDELWRHLHKLPVRYFDENPVGRLVTRVTNDTATLSDLFASVLATALSDIALFFGILGILLSLDVGLSLRLFLLAPPLIILSLWFKSASQKIYRGIRVQVAKVNTFLQEAVTGIVVVKAFTREADFSKRFQELNREFYKTQMRLIYIFAVFRPVIDAFAVSGIALVVWYGGGEALHNAVSVGTLVAFLLYLRMLFMPLQDLAEKFNILQSSIVASERLFKILDTPEEPSGSEIPAVTSGEIVFDNVSFAYEKESPVLKEVSFRVPPGKTVALVGPTGSGKTTIASLLLGFYNLPEGRGSVRVDGLDVRRWDVAELRKRFALVPQDLFLFSGTLGRNVTLFGSPAQETMERALSVSRLDKVIERLPLGLDHELNERGTVISQGERQLVSFARALCHSGQILILDEATASVDSRTEQLIQEALDDLLKGRTALIIAHRLSTVQEADLILVLKKGRIVEQGTHQELLSLGGLYSHLYRIQFSNGTAQ
ncbi:MAG: ABC transporter ATP-binding protein [Acidobacteria bacterium]|jgi:ABC-type multidrug transport system fused ATPase/permease subunit|nr:ABC transporter ATP-binding protein [Acidobacteriota bacterium]